jgi:dihydrofolate reductase
LDVNHVRTWRGIVFVGVSADGYIARSDGDITWLTDPPTDPYHVPGHLGPNPPAGYEDLMASVDHVLMGRGTYEKVLTFGSWPYETKRVIVLSTKLAPHLDERITVARDVSEVCTLLDRRSARGVYIDGGRVIQAFLREDLVDELTISTAPVVLGGGLPLFGTLTSDIRLTHKGTSTSDSGMTTSRYLVTR